MNPRSEWFKRNPQSESIRRIPTSDSLGLKDWSGFVRIQSLGLTRIATDWFLTELHQTRLKIFFGLTRMSSDWRGNRFRNKFDWFGMNFNPKLLPGKASICYWRDGPHSNGYRQDILFMSYDILGTLQGYSAGYPIGPKCQYPWDVHSTSSDILWIFCLYPIRDIQRISEKYPRTNQNSD